MKRAITFMILAVLTVTTVQAQSVDEVVNKYINAIGGAAKWKAVTSRKQTLDVFQGGAQIPGVQFEDNKNRQKMELTYSGMKMIQAYDGTTAWTINQFQGINAPTKLEGDQAKPLTESQFLNEFIDYKKRGYTVSYEGEAEFEGKATHKLKLTTKTGSETTHYFDKESGLKLGYEQSANGQTIVSVLTEHATQDGLTSPTKITQKIGGQALATIVIKSTEYNVAVTDDIYAFPGN